MKRFLPFILTIGLSHGVIAQDTAKDPYIQGPKQAATGTQHMVSTQTYLASETANEVLKKGGNAIDALITAVIYQMVTEPHMVSHFGIISGLYYEAETGEYHHFNGISERPLASRGTEGDAQKVAIAGTMRTLEDLHKRFGSWKWEQYFTPAIQAAEEGVLVTSYMYGIIYAAWENPQGIWPEGVRHLIDDKEARDFYLPNGFPVPVGQRWKMPKVADHLRKIAQQGADYVYTGEWGQKFVKRSNELGGRVSLEDMASYKTRWNKPLRYTYKGYEIVTEPLPVSGGTITAYNLNILDNFDLKKIGHYSESAEALEIMARTASRVNNEIPKLRDPLNYHTPVDLLLNKEYGRMGAEFVRNTRMREEVLNNRIADMAKEGKKEDIKPLTKEPMDSVHNVIVDSQGNWISSLHSGHGGTEGLFIDGIEANGSQVASDTFGEGRRLVAELAATFITKGGKPFMALGTPGFPPQPVTEVLVNLLDYQLPPEQAIDAPRFFGPYNNSQTLRIESRLSDDTRKGIQAAGFKLQEMGDYNWHAGSFQVIWRDEKTGKLHGISDRRRLGHASGE